MEKNRRISILPFPQTFDGNTLTLNIVVLPRNQDPLQPAIENNGVIPKAPAFADAELSFEAHIVSSLAGFPNNHSADDVKRLAVDQPTNARQLFIALGKNFDIKNTGATNEDLDSEADKAPKAKANPFPVRKYLPLSYRRQFNFTTPRTRAAVTDDSYHCAVRGAGKVPGFKRSPDTISWGKVFAYALRQPLLATQLGMIYQTTLKIDADHFPHGGWLFVNLTTSSDFKTQQLADDSFVKKYAVRIPALVPGSERQLFAPMLFPVQFKVNPGDPDPVLDGNFDQLFIETAEYDDGFAKIVHAEQPQSLNLLAEEHDGAHPVKDAGIRLGWDDEQILIWYLRQLAEDSSATNPEKRLDVPLGVFGYAVDVRQVVEPPQGWQTLNNVVSNAPLAVPNGTEPVISMGKFEGELPYQVYPMQLDGNLDGDYWLPMYFANWKGYSMVLPDQDAADVYQTNKDVKSDLEKPAPTGLNPTNLTGTGATGPAQNQLNKIYSAIGLNTSLRYGSQYDFRVRLRDLSGGGASPSANPALESPSSVGRCRFRRFVAPNQPRVENLVNNTDSANDPDSISIRRPLLGYPAVAYTGKYTDPISRLKTASIDMKGKEAFGIADPDVNCVEVIVEIETLKLDNLMSVSGRDNYVHLYTTKRFFAAGEEDLFDAPLEIPIVYKDLKVLHTGDELNLEDDFDLPADIDNQEAIFLPTARTVRLTLRAVCEDKPDNKNKEYYGLINEGDHNRDSRYGQIVEMLLYRESTDETDLFVDTAASQRLQGIFLQPDNQLVFDGKLTTLLLGKEVQKAPDIVQRIAKQLDLENGIGLTLVAPKGERVQFGCSSRIRHTLSPDNSSLTFSSKGDLSNHWLCCVQLTIDRDWTWNALKDHSFVLERTLRFTHDAVTETEVKIVGDIEVRRSASFESLHQPKRNYTRLIFIDAVEPKNERKQAEPNEQMPRFPDTIEVSYTIKTQFKAGHATGKDPDEQINIQLPITTVPAQVPKIASAGIALKPYQRNEKYSATEPRQRFLWIEFAEPIKDPNDTYFARVLGYAPDQLISNNHPELWVAPQEPSLPIDPEPVRVVIPGATNDLAGLSAMQAMQKASDSDRHYLLPLPPGLHANADELFGFFTYEFRVGHHRNRDTKEMAWCTAQGRFGRPLRATGIQHPAPTLTCAANRDEEKLWVTSPYAVAVHDGRNVTADPPRTQLWCLLYAQVRQADNADFRNILLDDKQLDWRIQIEDERDADPFFRYDDRQRLTLRNLTVKSFKDAGSYAKLSNVYKLKSFGISNKDATKYGTVVWSNQEVAQLLNLLGLPDDASLSVLVVEFLPHITNIRDHISGFEKPEILNAIRRTFGVDEQEPSTRDSSARLGASEGQRDFREQPSPLSEELGKHRILRTSPLTEVPFVCCPSC